MNKINEKMNVDKIIIADIFKADMDITYNIPRYQRQYTWGKTDWEAIFNDVMEYDNEEGYFLGSYICVNKSSLNGTSMELIDGQQRFTTISIILTALYERLNKLRNKLDDDDQWELKKLRKEVAIAKSKTEFVERLNLQKQNFNDLDYGYILYSAGVITKTYHKPDKYGYRRLGKAYNHFLKLIDDEIVKQKEDNPEKSEATILLDIKSRFEKAILVGIEVDSNRDAYMLFKSLNFRGVPLSALDLIKNTLISHTKTDEEAESAHNKWMNILDCVGQDDSTINERFFRQYYNAFREELNKPFLEGSSKKYPLGYLATKTTLIDIYEQILSRDYNIILDDILEKAQYYSYLINNENDDEKVYSKSLLDLERISGAPSYILLLYLLANQSSLDLSDEDIDWIVRVLIVFFVRRNVTDVPGTRKLIQLFIDCVDSIRDLAAESVKKTIKSKLREVSAPDDVFISKISGSIYDENADAARFILCDIEARNQSRETYTNLWERDSSNKYIWTIEHIFPEGDNIPKVWVDMIAAGDSDLAKEYKDKYVHQLGNLTITGYNSNLSNKSFMEKMERKSKDNKILGYKNGLFLNDTVVCHTEWTVDIIKERTAFLVDMITKMYDWDSL